jgi:hypothetical protein
VKSNNGTANNANGTVKKRRGPGNPSKLKPWPKGVSGNPKGAPKRGQSWAEVIKEIGEKTTDEIIEELGSSELAASFKKMPKAVTLKRLVTMRVMSAIMFEPQPGLFNAVMDRAEGKVQSTLDVTSAGEKLSPNIVVFKDGDEDSDAAAPAPDATGGAGGDKAV